MLSLIHIYDPQIAVLVAINDLPESATHTGGTIAAPVVGRIMEDCLLYTSRCV